METEFATLFKYIKNLRSRYLNILSSHKIFDLINTLSAPNKVGKRQAQENVETFNDFKYFFLTTKEACRCYFLIELAKFFDKDSRSLTLYKVLDYSEDKLNKLTKNDFLTFHKDRTILPKLFKDYKQLSKSDINKLNKKIKEKDDIIQKLITYRNKFLAHDDIQKIKVSISISEIKQLLTLMKNFISVFYLKLDFSSNSYLNFIKEPEREMKRLLDSLQKAEKQRKKDIEKKYNVKLK